MPSTRKVKDLTRHISQVAVYVHFLSRSHLRTSLWVPLAQQLYETRMEPQKDGDMDTGEELEGMNHW